MKKQLLIMATFTTVISCFGQLKVSSNGHVGIGVNYTTQSLLCIGGVGSTSYSVSLVTAPEKKGMYINNNAVTSGETEGLSIKNNFHPGNYTYGIRVFPNSSTSATTTYAPTYAISGRGGGSTNTNFGVVGDLSTTFSAPYGAGIYGSSTSSNTISHLGRFAGYFNGDVVVTNTIYSNLFSPLASNLSNVQTILSEEILGESISEKISSLQSCRVFVDSELQPQRLSESDIRLARDNGKRS